MHAQLRQAGIGGTHTHGARQHGAHGAAAAGVVSDLEVLQLGAAQVGDPVEDGGRDGVGGHVGVAVSADDEADIELGDVLGEIVADEVGVAGVGDVGRHEERLGERLADETGAVGSGVERLDSAFDRGGQEITPSALPQQGSNLFVVEQGHQLDVAVLVPLRGMEKSQEGGPRTQLVVDPSCGDELLVQAKDGSRLRVEKLELPVGNGVVRRDAKLLRDQLDQLGGLGVDKGAGRAKELDVGAIGAVQPNDGDSLRLRVVLAHHADAKVRRQRGDLGNRPIQLDQLAGGLARLLIAHNDSAADAQVSIPPSLVQGAGIGGNAELDIAGRVWLRADGLEPGCQSVDVAGDHANAVARLVGLADGKGDDGTAIAGDPVLAAGLDFVGPGVARRELQAVSFCCVTGESRAHIPLRSQIGPASS